MKNVFVQTVVVLCIFGFCQLVDGQDWNQWMGANRDGVWNESGIIKSIPKDGLKALWRAPVSGGFSGPAVSDNRVFVTDYERQEGDQRFNPGKRNVLKGKERLFCLDAKTGKRLWEYGYSCDYNISYGLGPRATPTVDGDRVYMLGAEGHLTCLDVKDGDVIWKRDFKKEYELKEAPIWGFAGHPLVYQDLLICLVGGDGSVAVAFDKKTGKEKWRALSAKDQGYCPPTLINAGGVEQLIIWHSEAVNSLNPMTGEKYWSVESKPAYGMSIIAPIKHDNYLLMTALQQGSILLELNENEPSVKEVWRGKGLNPDHNPPHVVDGHIYGVDEKGQLRCFNLKTGDRVWESMATATGGRPANSTTGFIVKNGDHWYITTEQGELIIAKMSPKGFEELGRAKMVEPTSTSSGRKIVWSHPAFANKCVVARNDKEIVCYSLAD